MQQSEHEAFILFEINNYVKQNTDINAFLVQLIEHVGGYLNIQTNNNYLIMKNSNLHPVFENIFDDILRVQKTNIYSYDTKNTLNHMGAVSILSQKQANRKRNNHTRFSNFGAEGRSKGES